MTDETREQRRTRLLRDTIPLYKYIELAVDELDKGARCSVPLSPANTNHVGIMHAGVLFSLAEAAGGVAISVHRDLARNAVIAKEVKVAYRRPATTRIYATATVTEEEAQQVRSCMAENPKHAFDVAVSLFDEQKRLVADGNCTFVLRPPPSREGA